MTSDSTFEMPGAVHQFRAARRSLVALLIVSLLAPALLVHEALADECLQPDEAEFAICGAFETFWLANGGEDGFGLPLTNEYIEISADTMSEVSVQYFERGRLEYHPANEGSEYSVIPGRVGSEVLEYVNGLDWQELPAGEDSAGLYFSETGHRVDAAFESYFRSNGLEFGDPGVTLRESLAMFGYPITGARLESNFGGEEVLTQWFERARLELHGDRVVMANLGIEMNSTINGFSPRIQRELDANLHYWRQAFNDTGMLAGLWVPSIAEWTNLGGAANRETGEPVSFDQYFRIGSISKEFTATMILQLADQDLLSIDDTIDNWVVGIPNGDRITLRHLASMTSGLASFTFDPEFQEQLFTGEQIGWTPEEIVAIGVENTLDGCPYAPESCFEPGEGWMYSNTNTVLLGLVLEAVTGQQYGDLVQEMILEPLGMEHTFHPTSSELPEPHATGYTTQGLPDDADGLLDATHWDVTWSWAVGSLVSTFDDLAIWARAVGAGELLSPEMQAERQKLATYPPNTPERAYAFGIGYDHGWWGHAGSIPGFNTIGYYRPDLDAVIVVMANSDQARYQGGFIDPAATFASILVDIVEREAPLGQVEQDSPWGRTARRRLTSLSREG